MSGQKNVKNSIKNVCSQQIHYFAPHSLWPICKFVDIQLVDFTLTAFILFCWHLHLILTRAAKSFFSLLFVRCLNLLRLVLSAAIWISIFPQSLSKCCYFCSVSSFQLTWIVILTISIKVAHFVYRGNQRMSKWRRLKERN